MLIYVEVLEETIDEGSMADKATGEVFEWRRQPAFIFNGGPYPLPFALKLAKGQLPWRAGKYLFSAGTWRSSSQGTKLSSVPQLIPISEALPLLQELVRQRPPVQAAA